MIEITESIGTPHTLDEPAGEKSPPFREQFMAGYRWMLLGRALDEKMASLYRGGKIHGGVYIGRGQEALSVGTALALRQRDVFAPSIRDFSGRLAFGEPILDGVRTYMGSALGPMRGREGNVHRGRPAERLLPMISHLGAMISVVNGILMASRYKGESGVVGAVNIGDGATSTGAFHEALNQAAVEKLPLILVVANNQYAYSTPTDRQFACRSLVDRALGYGVAGHALDGTDLEESLRVLNTAVRNARRGGGPQLVVAELLRLCGHGEHDDAHYIHPKFKQSSLGRDCLKVAEERLLEKKWADPAALETWRAEVARQVEEAVATVQREPAPDPFHEEWTALSTARLREGGGHG